MYSGVCMCSLFLTVSFSPPFFFVYISCLSLCSQPTLIEGTSYTSIIRCGRCRGGESIVLHAEFRGAQCSSMGVALALASAISSESIFWVFICLCVCFSYYVCFCTICCLYFCILCFFFFFFAGFGFFFFSSLLLPSPSAFCQSDVVSDVACRGIRKEQRWTFSVNFVYLFCSFIAKPFFPSEQDVWSKDIVLLFTSGGGNFGVDFWLSSLLSPRAGLALREYLSR